MPGEVICTLLEVTVLPLPKRPIWLKGEVLQLGGWQMAVMEAEPGKVGVMAAEPAPMVVGVVETYSSVRLVRGAPRVSTTVACRFSVVFWLTLAEVLVVPATASEMDAGGQTE